MTLLPHVLLIWPQQTRIVVVTISTVTIKTYIVTTTIKAVTVTSEIVTTTISGLLRVYEVIVLLRQT